jgi:hypothetical protein
MPCHYLPGGVAERSTVTRGISTSTVTACSYVTARITAIACITTSPGISATGITFLVLSVYTHNFNETINRGSRE